MFVMCLPWLTTNPPLKKKIKPNFSLNLNGKLQIILCITLKAFFNKYSKLTKSTKKLINIYYGMMI